MSDVSEVGTGPPPSLSLGIATPDLKQASHSCMAGWVNGFQGRPRGEQRITIMAGVLGTAIVWPGLEKLRDGGGAEEAAAYG